MSSGGSKSEDFRSVIDDLTVENKRLRQKLRKYERLHCSHLQGDKLFEVRMHGLPVHKKRELEETLRKFASSLETCPARPTSASPPQFTLPAVELTTRMDDSSAESYSRPADSAYASMFASGGTSVVKSQDKARPTRFPNVYEQDLKSYLHNVPEGLFPHHTPAMKEKVRMKLVVRRLEQLFTGKGPASDAYSHPQQQQEVSQSATRADRTKLDARGDQIGVEGVREARILPADAESLADAVSDGRLVPNLWPSGLTGCSSAQSRDEETNTSRDSSPDQRPTRPLDLDPNRAQVPSENIEYIRHLGFSSLTTDLHPNEEDGEGWVYLNLLTSMAQLHTINVTPNFVRKAVAEVSDRFELSRDGRKIRWRGGTEGTRMSSDVGSTSEQTGGNSEDDGSERNCKRRKLSHEPSDKETFGQFELGPCSTRLLTSTIDQRPSLERMAQPRRIPFGQATANDKLDYKPLFLHVAGTQKSHRSRLHSDDSLTSPGSGDDGTSTTSDSCVLPRPDMIRPCSERKSRDGPIIFYHGASFCTDLSGDGSGLPYEGAEQAEYAEHNFDLLGCAPSPLKDIVGDVEESRGLLSDVHKRSNPSSPGADDRTFGLPKLNLQMMQYVDNDLDSRVSVPIELEASGIGGVEPLDNFTITVQVRHVVSSLDENSGRVSASPRRHSLSAVCSAVTNRKGVDSIIRSEIVSAIKTNLRPSSLPPPSYFFLPFSSDSEEDGDSGSDSNEGGNAAWRSLDVGTELTESEGSAHMDLEEWSEESSDISAEVSDEDSN